jgi:hypothetical protein
MDMRSLFRLIIGVPLAVLVTGLLFLMMSALIRQLPTLNDP